MTDSGGRAFCCLLKHAAVIGQTDEIQSGEAKIPERNRDVRYLLPVGTCICDCKPLRNLSTLIVNFNSFFFNIIIKFPPKKTPSKLL